MCKAKFFVLFLQVFSISQIIKRKKKKEVTSCRTLQKEKKISSRRLYSGLDFSEVFCLFVLFFPSVNGTPLQYSCLENAMDGGAWWAAVHGVAKSQTRLSDFTFTFHFHALEKEMATCSSVLAWRISGTGEPDGLPSMGLHRVRHG